MPDQLPRQLKTFDSLDADNPATIDGVTRLFVLLENRHAPTSFGEAFGGSATGRTGTYNENVEFLMHK
jgi:hypothetical protein